MGNKSQDLLSNYDQQIHFILQVCIPKKSMKFIAVLFCWFRKSSPPVVPYWLTSPDSGSNNITDASQPRLSK